MVVPKTEKKQWLILVIGESLAFISGSLLTVALITSEIISGQSFGLLENIGLAGTALVSSFSSICSFTLLKDGQQFVASLKHLMDLEPFLSYGKLRFICQ
jgi:hypothetical protein